MPEEPLIRFDPQRLHDERQTVDLGEEETGFDQVASQASKNEAAEPPLDTTTSGSTPPAR